MYSCDVITYAYKVLHICEHVHEINPFVLCILSEDHFIDRLRPLCVRNYTCRLLLSTTEDFTMGNLVLYGECNGLAYTCLKVNV